MTKTISKTLANVAQLWRGGVHRPAPVSSRAHPADSRIDSASRRSLRIVALFAIPQLIGSIRERATFLGLSKPATTRAETW